MKEALETTIQDSLSQRQAAREIRQEKQKYFNLPYMQRGHTMFEIDPRAQTVQAAELSEAKVHFSDPDLRPKKHIVAKAGCIYLSALNETNAIKRYARVQNAKFKR